MLDGLDDQEERNSSVGEGKISKSHESASGGSKGTKKSKDIETDDTRLNDLGKIIPQLHRKSLSMDIFAQARLKYKQKKKFERGGSAGLDLRSLKLFVDDGEASDSSDQKNHRH